VVFAKVEIDLLDTLLYRSEKMHYHCVNASIKRGTNASTSREKVVKIGSATSELKKGVCGIFATTGQKNWAKIGIYH